MKPFFGIRHTSSVLLISSHRFIVRLLAFCSMGMILLFCRSANVVVPFLSVISNLRYLWASVTSLTESKTEEYKHACAFHRSVRRPVLIGGMIFQKFIQSTKTSPTITRTTFSSSNRYSQTGNEAPINNIGEAAQQLQLKLRNLTPSRYDARVFEDFLQCKQRQSRYASRSVLVEGVRALRDSLRSGARLKRLCVTIDSILKELPLPKASQYALSKGELEMERLTSDVRLNALAHFVKRGGLLKITHDELRMFSDTKTPAGVVAVCEMPHAEWSEVESAAVETQKNDAAVFPVTLICDNLRDPANAGPLIRSAAALRCASVLFTKGCVDIWEPKVLRGAAGAHFLVPLFSRLDWKDIDALWPLDSVVLAADAHNKLADARSLWNVPVFATQSARLALVLGGETCGITQEARDFVEKRVHALRAKGCAESECGGLVHVPMDSRVDSLNTTVAASVILFELKRQFLSRKL